MDRQIFVNINPHESRVAITENGELAELHVEMYGHEGLVGNIYKGKVENILPGMQAAFIDIGLSRNAFLYAGDILVDNSDYDFCGSAEKQAVPNIKDILKPNQEILVQVLKQPGGTKGARVTTHITLPGKLVVLMPTVGHIGVSRRISNPLELQRLKEIAERVTPPGMGVIIRTAAKGASEETLAAEIGFYVRLWERIQKKADFTSGPRLIHAEETLLFRTLRDLFTDEVSLLVIDDKDYYDKIRAITGITQPELVERIRLHEDFSNLFDVYSIESKLERALDRKVWLKNGCYLVIDEAEALTVIDVNTGKYIGKSNLQETILNANIEAAQEIARQLRLRDISGIIVIDFIDMEDDENKAALLAALKAALAADRTKSTVLGITELGLVEMTRKKTSRKLSSMLTTTCPYCGGNGRVFTDQTMAMRVRRDVIRVAGTFHAKYYLIEVAPPVASYLKNKNNMNECILPRVDNAAFYIKSQPSFHLHDVRVTPLASKTDERLKNSVVFC